MPEILLLHRRMIMAIKESEVLKQVDEDCNKIVDRIVEGVKAENFDLSEEIFRSCGSSILEVNMALIVVRVHLAGTLEDTLLLLKYSRKLPMILCQRALIQALFETLKSKNLIETEHGLHLWAHAKSVQVQIDAELVNRASDQEEFTSTFSMLCSNRLTFFKIYQSYIENSDRGKITALHKSNWQLKWTVSEFVDFYYDGDLVKAGRLLSAAKNLYYCSRIHILNSLHKKMSQFDQLGTFEAFRIFTLTKEDQNAAHSSWREKYEELQAKAPPCLQLLLWPKPAGVKFRLVNEYLKTPLYCVNMKVLCGVPPASCRDTQSWSAQTDPSSGLTTFKVQERNFSYRFLNAKRGNNIPVGLASKGTGWRVEAVDEHHVKLHSASKCRLFNVLSLFYSI
jgi:hypothetical protein